MLENTIKMLVNMLDYYYKDNLIGIHPNQNDATVWLQGKDLVKLIEEHGTTIEYIDLY